ncbi:MAG TPA: NAD(P)/FAD-dependent oxidoreductase [Ktedonobacterales bacterium]
MITDTFAQPPVIIVGGGLTGLSAAAILARAGHAVTVFEQSGAPGGRARTKQQGDFLFNQGAHALIHAGPSEKLLDELGVPYSGSIVSKDKFQVLEDGKLHTMPTGLTSLARTTLLKPAAKAEFIRLFTSLNHINPAQLHNVTLHDWLERHIRHPQLRQLFLALARLTTYTNAPDMLSAGLFIPLLSVQVRYLDGGWQTLVDGLRQVAQAAGAEILTHARVAAIEISEDKHTVHLANGTSYTASAVLLAVGPQDAAALLTNGAHTELSRWAEQSIPARAACFDVALRRLPEPRHVYVLGIDRPLYYSVHSAWAKLAPQGGALIHTMKYLRPDEPADPETSRQELEALLDTVQPGWRTEVVEQSFLPHMTPSNAIVQAAHGGLPARPGPAVPGIRNLYLAGDWVGTEGHLTDACFASAREAARMIMTSSAVKPTQYAMVN